MKKINMFHYLNMWQTSHGTNMEAFYNEQSITQMSNTVIRANQPLVGGRLPQVHPVPCQVGRCHYDEEIYDAEMVKKTKQNGYVL